MNKRMLICVFTGFSSGLPLYILISLLPAWLRSEGVDLKAIGLFALISLPFTWKFLWAPFFDRYAPPMGRRRGWLIITQIALLLSIPVFGFLHAQLDIWTIAYLATTVAFFSASQDIVLDAYRREILPDIELGLGNVVHVNAYKISGLIPGSLSLILADSMPWSQVFIITALFMLPGIAMTLLVKEPALKQGAPKTLRASVVEPFHEFISRNGLNTALIVLAFIFLYKLGDSMATALATPFYLDMGFTKTEIGIIAKSAGLWASVVGGILGGIWMIKLGINRALWIFGAVQMVTILGFAWLAQVAMLPQASDIFYSGSILCPIDSLIAQSWVWADIMITYKMLWLGLVIGAEAFGVGLGTAAFVAYIAKTTHPLYTATQFALFTSLAAVPRTLVNAGTGYMVETLGWVNFYILCFVLAIPGMLLLVKVAPWNGKDNAVQAEM